jgi:hypothetical protein
MCVIMDLSIFLIVFLFFFSFIVVPGGGYIVAFPKVLTMYPLYGT